MLILLLIYLLVSNALTTRRDKSILFSRVVIMSLLMVNFIAYNNLYLNPLSKGIQIYGGLFEVTVHTQTFSIFILLVSAVILTLNVVYTGKFNINRLTYPFIGASLSSSLKLPFLLGLTQLNIPYIYVIVAPFVALIVINVVSHLSISRFLKFKEAAPILLFTIAVCFISVLFREYGIEWPFLFFIGDAVLVEGLSGLFTGIGLFPALHTLGGPSNVNPPRVTTSSWPTTLNSDQANNTTTGSGSVPATNPVASGSGTTTGTPTGTGAPVPDPVDPVWESVSQYFRTRQWYPLSSSAYISELRGLKNTLPSYEGTPWNRLNGSIVPRTWNDSSREAAKTLHQEIQSMYTFDYNRLSPQSKEVCNILMASYIYRITGNRFSISSTGPHTENFKKYLEILS